MKQNIIILAAALVAFAACSKEQAIEQPATKGLEISATVEQQMDNSTKSSLSGTTVSWTAGDQIKVFDNAGKGAKLVAQTAATSTSFKEPATPVRDAGFNESNLSCAIYPYSDAVSCSGTTITFTLPATQDYAANSFGPGANVAVGTVSGTSIAFKNVCGVFKLTLYGNYTVSTIELSGKSNEKLNGSYSVDASSYTCTCATTSTDSEKTITLNCGTSGVTLSPTTATTFYFVVPAGAFASGFVAKVYEKDNTTSYTYTELSTTSANNITRSKVKAMPESTILPPTYQKVEYLEGSGGQFIITTVYPNKNYTFDVGVAITADNTSIIVFGVRNDGDYLSDNQQCYFHSNKTSPSASDIRNFKLYSTSTTGSKNWDSGIVPSLNTKYEFQGMTCVSTMNDMTYPLQLFGINNMGTHVYYPGLCRIYYWKAYESKNAVAYFIPCYCKSGASYTDGNTDSSSGTLAAAKPGMYDLKTGKFFVNQGTDADFTTGSAVTH